VYIKQAPLDAKADAPAIIATPAPAASARALPLLNTSAYKKHVRLNARRGIFFATRDGIHVALSGSSARSAKDGARFERRGVGRGVNRIPFCLVCCCLCNAFKVLPKRRIGAAGWAQGWGAQTLMLCARDALQGCAVAFIFSGGMLQYLF